MSILTIVGLLVFLSISAASGISLVDQGLMRCRCITVEKRPIGRYVRLVEVNPPSSHCNDIEIIATLKKDGQKVCLDPHAPWVKKVLEKKRNGKKDHRCAKGNYGLR